MPWWRTPWWRTLLLVVLVCATAVPTCGHIHKRKGFKGTAGGGEAARPPQPEAGSSTATTGGDGVRGGGDREFIWFSNKAGIFSQYVQLKIMHYLMEKSKRVLTIAPSYSPHYGDLPIILCDIFVLPGYIRCPVVVTLPEDLQCITHTISLDQIASDKNKLCYQGPLPRLGAKTPREAIIRGVDIPLPLRFQANYTRLADAFKLAIGLASDRYTVVHWRRGDQLSTRCQQRKDQSINCGSAEELVSKVRDRTNDSFVYVATNEVAGSSELEVLREAGFRLFSDAKMDVGVIEAFLIEVSLMRDAHTFLGWGVSEVNDVVEFERRNAGKAWCATAQDDLQNIEYDAGLPSEGENEAKRIDNKGDPTWCAAQLQLQLANGTNPLRDKAIKRIEVNKRRKKDDEEVRSKESGGGFPVVSHAFESSYNFTAELDAIIASGADFLSKRMRSRGKRLLFVAGLEGSGHELLARVMHSCGNATRSSALCEKDIIMSSLLLDLKGREISGLYATDDSVMVIRLVNSIEGRLRRMNASFASEPVRHHLIFLGLGASVNRGTASMLTYPVGPVGIGAGCDKTLSHPDVFLLALLCERAGIDLRILVLQRSAKEILSHVSAQISQAMQTGATGHSFSHGAGLMTLMQWQRGLVSSAAQLASQLSLLDPTFFLCVHHDDLATILGSSAGRWGATKDVYNRLAEFVHPVIFPEAIKAAWANGGVVPGAAGGSAAGVGSSPAPTNSSSSDGLDSSPTNYQWNYFYANNAGYSASLHEFQLTTRLRQIDALCRSRSRRAQKDGEVARRH